jgi:competence protein ComEA
MHFTKEEKTILIMILAAAVAGILINIIFSYNKKIQEKPEQSSAILIDINTATAEDLDRLPGVGKITAARIIEYREKNGAFKSADDLLKVKGITAKKLEKFRPFVMTGGAGSTAGNTGGKK